MGCDPQLTSEYLSGERMSGRERRRGWLNCLGIVWEGDVPGKCEFFKGDIFLQKVSGTENVLRKLSGQETSGENVRGNVLIAVSNFLYGAATLKRDSQ